MNFSDFGKRLAENQAATAASLSRSLNEYTELQARKDRQQHDAERALIQLGVLGGANVASEFHKRLAERIQAFEASLNQSQDVGVQLVSFGQSINFHVSNVGFYNPSLILFRGQLEDGSPVELIQHVSQLSFLLVAMKRVQPDQPKRKIGFSCD